MSDQIWFPALIFMHSPERVLHNNILSVKLKSYSRHVSYVVLRILLLLIFIKIRTK